MIRLRIRNFASSGVLSGATSGRTMASKLSAAVADHGSSGSVVLDFADVQVATASFLREAVLGFRHLVRHEYPCIAVTNLNADVLDDLQEILVARDEVLPALPGSEGCIDEPIVLGELDRILRDTLDAVVRMGGATARTLADKFPDQKVGVTAWNNRLASLADLGLVICEQRGRTKEYFSALERVANGHRLHRTDKG